MVIRRGVEVNAEGGVPGVDSDVELRKLVALCGVAIYRDDIRPRRWIAGLVDWKTAIVRLQSLKLLLLRIAVGDI